MKPIKLRIINIGPFVGEHIIDFTNLDNIYVITGKTGSGKTTILDCITYALYGKLPGSRAAPDRRYMRSDFCSTSDISSIAFDFSIVGKSYRVERTLPFNKITKKGTQKEEGETATLFSIGTQSNSVQTDLFSQDNGMTILESQKSLVDEKIEKMLLLSIDEFTRIVLLPQGEFATFLKQNSRDRKGLLLKLFPIEQFSRICENIKERKANYEAAAKEIQLQVNQLQASFNPETAEKEKKELEDSLLNLKVILDKYQKEISALMIEEQKLLDLCKKFDEKKAIEQKLLLLESQKQEIEELEKRVLFSFDAEKLLPLANNYTSFSSELEKNIADKAECTKQLEEFNAEKKALANEESTQEKNSKRLSELDMLLHDLQRCVKLQDDVNSFEMEAESLQQKATECAQELSKIYEAEKEFKILIECEQSIISDWEKAHIEIKKIAYKILLYKDASLSFLENAAIEAHKNANEILEAFIKEEREQKLFNTASTLVDLLEKDTPCPVCGSLEHPKPALQSKEILDIGEKITKQESIVKQATLVLDDYKRKRYTISGTIEESKKSLADSNVDIEPCKSSDECINKIAIHEKAHLEALEKHKKFEQDLHNVNTAKEKIKTNETLIQSLQEKNTALQIQIASKTASIEHTKNELEAVLKQMDGNSESILENINKLTLEKNHLTQECDKFIIRKKDNENAILILTEKKVYIEKNIETQKEGKESSETQLITALQNSKLFNCDKNSFSNDNIENYLEIIKTSVMDSNKKSNAQQNIDQYKNELLTLQTLQKKLSEEIKGNEEDIKAKESLITKTIEEKKQELEQSQNEFSNAQQRLAQITTLHSEYSIIIKREQEASAKCELYTKLYNILSGSNPKKIPLDSWILGMYLQEITIYANSRLKRMSNGRYALYLKQDAEGGNAHKGLDLEIFDDYTGKLRPTSTLSGGETFMASISLALAISDMVQEQNGGVQLDSMFIDEGFGSLDAESLEKALGILDEIRETRSVGLISHVESLKNRIASQIRVNKFASGSYIEIANNL